MADGIEISCCRLSVAANTRIGRICHLDASSIEVAQRIEKFCANICKALGQPWLSREERRQAETRRVAEGERRRYEAEKKRQLIAVDAASAPKSNVDQILFAPGPVIGGFIAVAAAAVFLLLAYFVNTILLGR